MARLTRHPVAHPPVAPEREATSHLAMRAYAAFVLFSGLAYSWWYNLLGAIGAAILIALVVAGSLAIWIPRVARRGFAWQRLPWAALGYVALAGASTAWSDWPGATVATWVVLVAFTLQGVIIADMLSWREIVRALEAALRWIIGGSIAIEVWVAVILHHPIMPNFFPVDGDPDPHWYWVRGNLFDSWLVGERIQGIVGNSNLLGMLAVIAIIVFAARLRLAVIERLPAERIVARSLWLLAAVWILMRAGSATSIVAGALAVAVLCAALLMRRESSPSGRTRIYVLCTLVAAGGAAIAVFGYNRIVALLGRDGGLTGRSEIWDQVIDRARDRPAFGHGFSSPWVPWDPAFDGWIIDHGITVFEAHNMWLDVFLQLGAAGILVIAIVYGSAVWRAWFHAVDRPRGVGVETLPFSPLSLVPLLILWALLAQGIAESNPIMLWGWMLVVLFTSKLRQRRTP